MLLVGCGSSSRAGSVSPHILNADSFAGEMHASLPDTAAPSLAAVMYNPPSRLENEIAPGYLITLRSNQDSNLSGEFRISEQGFLDLPYNVRVTAMNTSVAELRSLVRDAYRPFFRGTPDVEIAVKERKVWVRAQGLVTKPGSFLIDATSGLDQVIAEAGGLKTGADGISGARFAKITGDSGEAVVRLSDFYGGKTNLVSSWRGGESVFFQNDVQPRIGEPSFDAKYIHVLGQVRAPGEYAFKDQANFFYYLVQAGGPTDRANTDKILLVRSNEAGKGLTSSRLSLSDLEDAPALHGGDVLFVQADNLSDIQKDASVLGSIGGFLGSIATTVLVGQEL